MTLDYPDWSRVASGTVRYLGHISVLGSGGSATGTYTILPSERSLIYMLAVPTTAPVLVQASGASGFTTRQCNFGTFAGLNQNIPMAVPVAASIDTSWTVSVSAPGPAGSADVYVFASTDPAPLANPAYPQPVAVSDGTNLLIGQQRAAASLPVVLASDQSLPVGSTVNTTPATTSTNAAANTLQTGALIAAPGAGKAIRLWKLILGSLQNAAAATIRAGVQSGSVSVEGYYSTPSGMAVLDFPGGLLCPVNTAVTWFNAASAAGPITARTTALYTVE